MNKAKKKQIIKALIIIIIILLAIIRFELFLFRPFLSVYSVCNTQDFEEDFNENYVVGGTTTLEQVGNETQIKISLGLDQNGEIDTTVLKHEIIHIHQMLRGRPSLSCNHPVQKYLSEVEAYTFQWLPEPIFKRIYNI